jgi:hypothetical protein
MNLILESFLLNSRDELNLSHSITRFMELRYDVLNKIFPHKTFSVNQASLDFFDNALNHLRGHSFDSKEKVSEYELNYREWILKNRA